MFAVDAELHVVNISLRDVEDRAASNSPTKSRPNVDDFDAAPFYAAMVAHAAVHSTLPGVTMKTANVLLLAALTAVAAASVAAPLTTDEARAEASQRNAAGARAAALTSHEPVGPSALRVTDTESARAAAAESNRGQAHESHLTEVLRAASGAQPAPIKVTDTDSARAAAAQHLRGQSLATEYTKSQSPQAGMQGHTATR